jgi:hypothetical protein
VRLLCSVLLMGQMYELCSRMRRHEACIVVFVKVMRLRSTLENEEGSIGWIYPDDEPGLGSGMTSRCSVGALLRLIKRFFM